jgi:hypothetical protein
LFVVNLRFLDYYFHQAFAVIRIQNRKRPVHPDFINIAPQYAAAERMESADPYAAAVMYDFFRAFLHFAGGFVRERYRQYVERVYSRRADKVRHPVYQNPRLARPCARQQQQRPFDGGCRLRLYRV